MPADMFKVTVRFVDRNNKPVTGDGYLVRLLDEDRLFDDKLGQSSLDAHGEASFLFSVADVFSIDSLDERTPDLYFVLEHKGDEVFRSDTYSETNFDAIDPVTRRPKGLTKAFGPFTVDTG